MRQRVARWVTSLSFLLGVVVFLPAPALAQHGGIRGGISVDPDQVYFGGHLETSPLVDRVYFRPNLEIGVGNNNGNGNDLTTIAANMEFVYKFTTRRPWNLYVGAGPALNLYKFAGETNTEAGLNMLVGVEQARGLFFEFKIGAIDSPDFKFGVGWTFK